MGECVLKTNGIVKYYGQQKVLDEVYMNIDRGDIYGFVGENGSGKTTLIRVVSGLITGDPNGGGYELFGVPNTDPKILNFRKKMGAIVESPSVYTNMTAEENLGMLCTMFAIPKNRIATTLQMVGLGNMIGNAKKVGNYSLGMRQRLGIAMSLITEAEFMILDEPLNGLDPEGIVEMRNLILKLNKEYGITFLISSHILTELSLVATKYGIISKGHIIKEITADELANECEKYYDIVTLDKKATLDALLTITDASNIREKENGYIVKANELELSKVMASLTGLPIQAINTVTTSIEDYYLSVIKGGRR